MIKDLGRIYFDTNALWDGNWPALNRTLQDIFELATRLPVSILIPAPVEQEVETLWLRKMFDARGQFEGHAEHVVRREWTVPLPWDLIRQDYKAAVAKVKARWSIGTPSFPRRSLADAFEEFVSQEPPYESIKGEFRDAVIYLSVVEDLGNTGTVGALVSRDAGLKGMAQEWCARAESGLRQALVVLEGLSVLRSELSALEDAKLKADEREWKHRNYNLLRETLLGENKAKLESYIRSHIQFPPDPADFPLRIHSWSVEVLAVEDISTPASRTTPDGAKVSFSANVEVRLRGIMQPRLYLNQPPYQIGWHLGSASVYDVYCDVGVQATATYYSDRYADVVLESAELSSVRQFGLAPRSAS